MADRGFDNNNHSTMKSAHNLVFHKRGGHIVTRYHFILGGEWSDETSVFEDQGIGGLPTYQ